MEGRVALAELEVTEMESAHSVSRAGLLYTDSCYYTLWKNLEVITLSESHRSPPVAGSHSQEMSRIMGEVDRVSLALRQGKGGWGDCYQGFSLMQ